jgi:Flp pilus assembly protein TadD
VDLEPTRGAAHYYLGEAYNHVDQLSAALNAYEAAARLQPGNWRAFKGVGIVLDRMGRPVEAAIAYKRAREVQSR